MNSYSLLTSFLATQAAFAAPSPLLSAINRRTASPPVVNQTTCDGKQFTYEQLAGYGSVPSNARDKYGDTLGGYGSAIALDRSSWQLLDGSYTGTLWTLPDRGWYEPLPMQI